MLDKIENSVGSSTLVCPLDAKTIAANKSHSEAERRRRKRINAHLGTLRTLIPKTIKADKASLLAEVVQYLRELQEKRSESVESASYPGGFGGGDGDMNIASAFPSETDELELSYCDESNVFVQVTLWYEDGPEILVELTRAIKSIQGKIVKAEMATIGGRTKNVLWVQLTEGGGEGLLRLKKALKLVLSKANFLSAPDQVSPGSKRHRLYHS